VNDPRPLGSTYRLQLNGLGFSGARQLVSYLSDLGIETMYLSPILEAVPGSTHGYDVINPTRLDPELGTAEEFEALLVELDAHDMQALIDIVPNHMAAHHDNEWWWDTLRLGQSSPFANTFDIDWSRHVGRVLIPTLSHPLEDLLHSVAYVGEDPDRVMEIDSEEFPLAPGTHTGSDLGAVLSRQHYRPSYWRLSNREGNYRRFFDIDGLVGVRVEAPDVFHRTHHFITSLADDDRVAGWRADHVDGLTDPRGYLERLGSVPPGERETRPIVLIEKIVARDEGLPKSWRTDGTTGYEFGDRVGGLFVNERGARLLAGDAPTFSELSHDAKRAVIVNSFDAALERLARLSLLSLNEYHPGHDLSWFDIRRALTEISVSLDVYRTYFANSQPDDDDRERLTRAVRDAEATLTGESRRAVGLIGDVLAATSGASLELAQRWQQLSSAAMAKGAEDTATYRYRGLLSHAEVGCDPDHASYDVSAFHEFASERLAYPLTLSATSTHDSKRSEDSRARLFVLSELPEEWGALVNKWQRRYRLSGQELNIEDELRAYQSFVCLWPLAEARPTRAITRRIQDYAVKAAREAKCRTTWTDPDDRYERSLRRFVASLASDVRFTGEMSRLMRKIAPAAVTNSLAMLALKCVAPGVPDFYQGVELFHYTLTDPDNRRAIDFASRRTLLSRLPNGDASDRASTLRALLKEGDDGALKLYITRNLLHLRRAHPDLFARGSYQGLATTGTLKKHALSFARTYHDQWVVVCVPRQTLGIARSGNYVTESVWNDTVVRLPKDAPSTFVDVLSGDVVRATRGRLELAQCFAHAPVSILLNSGDRDN
jgi:(1->4)-alpha-D-glucan 1-alpha-D-glucosylmutase